MRPEISITRELKPDSSVVYLTYEGQFPGEVSLSTAEKEFAKKRFSRGDKLIHINSYYRSVFIVSIKSDIPVYQKLEEFRVAAAKSAVLAKEFCTDTMTIVPLNVPDGSAEAFAEGLILSLYNFNRYKSDRDNDAKQFPSAIQIYSDSENANIDAEWITNLTAAVYMARDMVNEPVSAMNTESLTREIVRMGEISGYSTEVLGKTRIEALRMGGLLAVNRGSVDPPSFLILEWNPHNSVNSKPVVLVGKGIVFDTGGMNLKPGTYMEGMKSDMAGAAAVAGAMYTLAATKVPLHTIALIPVTDNRVDGNPIVTGDIIKMHNGKTVEVINTDAEGRLILADALSYSSSYSPMLVISVATLTGSAAAILGIHGSAIMGNAGKNYFDIITETGEEVYERVARLPFWHEYGESMKSDIADYKNVDNRDAGAIKAGKFLEFFTDDPFIHIDIAGTGFLKKDDSYRTKGGPGWGVRLLSAFCRKLSETEND